MAEDRYLTLCRLYREAEDKVEFVTALIDQLRTAETENQSLKESSLRLIERETPGPQRLTRNRYRLHAVKRFPSLDGVEFILSVNGQERARLQLPTSQFNDLTADLGMRPTNPEATEYESMPMSETTAGREKACPACLGCGQVDDGETGEPWSAWQALPPGSDVAVRLGLVKPLPCPLCHGTGKA